MQKHWLKSLFIIALAMVFIGTSFDADARRERRQKKGKEKVETMYPNAKRESPAPKVGRTMGKKLQKLADLQGGDDAQKLIAKANEIIGAKKASNYEKAFAYQLSGFTKYESEDTNGALADLNKAIELDALPNDQHFQLMFQAAQMYLMEEQYNKALPMLDRFLKESGSKDPKHLVLKGNALYRMEKFDQAAAITKQAIDASDAPEASWLQILMASYFEGGKTQQALSVGKEILAKNPNDMNMVRNLAGLYQQNDELATAAGLLDDARKRGIFTDAKDYEQLAQIYNYNEKEAQAINVLQDGISKGVIKPTAQTYTTMGQSYFFMDKPKEAIETLKKGQALETDGSVSSLLSRIYVDQDMNAQAKSAAQKALSFNPKRKGRIYMALGAAEVSLGNTKAAVSAFREAMKDSETKQQAEQWLRDSGKL